MKWQGRAVISENMYVSFTTVASTTSAMTAACVRKVSKCFQTDYYTC